MDADTRLSWEIHANRVGSETIWQNWHDAGCTRSNSTLFGRKPSKHLSLRHKRQQGTPVCAAGWGLWHKEPEWWRTVSTGACQSSIYSTNKWPYNVYEQKCFSPNTSCRLPAWKGKPLSNLTYRTIRFGQQFCAFDVPKKNWLFGHLKNPDKKVIIGYPRTPAPFHPLTHPPVFKIQNYKTEELVSPWVVAPLFLARSWCECSGSKFEGRTLAQNSRATFSSGWKNSFQILICGVKLCKKNPNLAALAFWEVLIGLDVQLHWTPPRLIASLENSLGWKIVLPPAQSWVFSLSGQTRNSHQKSQHGVCTHPSNFFRLTCCFDVSKTTSLASSVHKDCTRIAVWAGLYTTKCSCWLKLSLFTGASYHENCNCPEQSLEKWLKVMKCPASIPQIEKDLSIFPKIDFKSVSEEIIGRFGHSPGSIALAHYVIKDNKVSFTKHVVANFGLVCPWLLFLSSLLWFSEFICVTRSDIVELESMLWKSLFWGGGGGTWGQLWKLVESWNAPWKQTFWNKLTILGPRWNVGMPPPGWNEDF